MRDDRFARIAGGDTEDAERAEVCEYAGHEWADAGGGLLICLRCEAEKWAVRGVGTVSNESEESE